MAEQKNIRRSLLLRTRLAQLFQKRAVWSSQLVQALNVFRQAARERQWEAFLFGGVPRGLWVHGTGGSVRDFDIVVADDAFGDVLNAFGKNVVRHNRFGGAKLLIQENEFDVWPLSRTWAFAEGLFESASFQVLPRTTFLTIDSIVIELAPRSGTRRRVFESGFFRSVTERRLDICLERNPYPELCAVRSLRIGHIFGFSFSSRLATYIRNVVRGSSSDILRQAQLQHYGRLLFDQNELQDITDRIATQLIDAAEDCVEIFPTHATQTYFWSDWTSASERSPRSKVPEPTERFLESAPVGPFNQQLAFALPGPLTFPPTNSPFPDDLPFPFPLRPCRNDLRADGDFADGGDGGGVAGGENSGQRGEGTRGGGAEE